MHYPLFLGYTSAKSSPISTLCMVLVLCSMCRLVSSSTSSSSPCAPHSFLCLPESTVECSPRPGILPVSPAHAGRVRDVLGPVTPVSIPQFLDPGHQDLYRLRHLGVGHLALSLLAYYLLDAVLVQIHGFGSLRSSLLLWIGAKTGPHAFISTPQITHMPRIHPPTGEHTHVYRREILLLGQYDSQVEILLVGGSTPHN